MLVTIEEIKFRVLWFVKRKKLPVHAAIRVVGYLITQRAVGYHRL
jgi:hypothetical protein